MAFTQIYIKAIFTEFQSIKTYRGKLTFYDTHFLLILRAFPGFNNDLYTFFSDENMTLLIDRLNDERKTPFKTIQKFTFDHIDYIFSIKPSYSNYAPFNDYLLAKCLTRPSPIARKSTSKKTTPSTLSEMIDTAHEMARIYARNHPNHKTLPVQIVQVFCKGLSDFSERKKPVFTRKKKLLELYLYAQGLLFAQHSDTLRHPAENRSDGQSPFPFPTFHSTLP